MKGRLGYSAIGFAGSLLGALLSFQQPAYGFSFDQKEVTQDQFIAIAVPLVQGDSYNLLILEQVSSAKKCWQEDSSQPGVVEPLLLNFDFTGICGRSTDSNGYSIRIAGQDLGLDYKLSVRKRGSALSLIGYSFKDPSQPELVIGKTVEARSGFLKIELEPEWRFAKRTYEGKTLGHIYLTRDNFPEPPVADNIAQDPERSEIAELEVEQSSNNEREKSSDRIATSRSTANRPEETRKPRRSNRSGARFIRPITIPVPRPSTISKARSIPLAASAATQRPRSIPLRKPTTAAKVPPTRTSGGFTTPIQIPVPQPRQPIRAPRQYQAPPPPSSTGRGLPILSAGVLPVPNAKIPIGNAQGRSRVYRGLPSEGPTSLPGGPPAPPTQVAWVSHRYRVVVKTRQQDELRALVPDAFRSTYRSQPVLQVGAYRTPEEANRMMQLLSRHGFEGILEKR